jgi:hypothetical protein
MLRSFVWIILTVLELHALTPQELVGNWSAARDTKFQGTKTIEKEYLQLREDHTFTIQLLVTVRKGNAYIKDLNIKGSGIWRNRDDTLVIYIKKVEVPFAKEIYRISQESLRALANNFKSKYEDAPLRIIFIKRLNNNHLVTLGEKMIETTYTRY